MVAEILMLVNSLVSLKSILAKFEFMAQKAFNGILNLVLFGITDDKNRLMQEKPDHVLGTLANCDNNVK